MPVDFKLIQALLPLAQESRDNHLKPAHTGGRKAIKESHEAGYFQGAGTLTQDKRPPACIVAASEQQTILVNGRCCSK